LLIKRIYASNALPLDVNDSDDYNSSWQERRFGMPIYTYRCENCGVQFDRQQHFDDPVLKRCPECNKNKLRKVFLPVGIVFKGSGFYSTDHRSPSWRSSPRKSEDKETKSEGKTKTKAKESTKKNDSD
jgi:putative FmdB family regulatory protein